MRYREMRLPCDTEILVMLGEEARRARFVNISPSGARIEGIGRVPRDALLIIGHLNARHPARVVWSNDRQTGLRFLPPLSGTEVNALRGVGGSVPEPWEPGAPPRFRELT